MQQCTGKLLAVGCCVIFLLFSSVHITKEKERETYIKKAYIINITWLIYEKVQKKDCFMDVSDNIFSFDSMAFLFKWIFSQIDEYVECAIYHFACSVIICWERNYLQKHLPKLSIPSILKLFDWFFELFDFNSIINN